MNITISPLDSRYASKLVNVKNYFSEFSFKYRIRIEIEYLIELCKLNLEEIKLDDKDNNIKKLRKLYLDFNLEDYKEIKKIENKISHDVKSIEYWLKNKFKILNLEHLIIFIHFGLTSQDVNNTAVSLSIKEYIENEYIPSIESLINIITTKIKLWENVVMLAHTHGQPAVPTKMGKEYQVF